MINCVLLLVLGTGTLPVETTTAVALIDSIVQNYLDQNLQSAVRPFLGTLSPVQGAGVNSWEVFIYEDRFYFSEGTILAC